MKIRQDHSYLFSGFQNNNNSNNMFYGINLADYASIKNGSYGKTLKAYYKEMNSEQSSSNNKNNVTDKNAANKTETSWDSVKKQELVDLQKYTDELQSSSDKLLKKGSASLFKTEYRDSDKEALYKAVSDFVSDYNNVLEKGSASGIGSVSRMSKRLNDTAGDHEQALEAIGITMDKGKLNINKDAFMKADMDQVKKLFNEDNSFGQFVSRRTETLEYTIQNEAKKNKIDISSVKKEEPISPVDKNTNANTDSSTNKTESSTDSTWKKEMTNMQKFADELQGTANKLLQKGSASLFKTEYKEEDKKALYDTVSKFVSEMNTVLDKGKTSSSDTIVSMAERMEDTVKDYKELLGGIGISMNKESMTIDEDSFMKADMELVESLFNKTNSFGYFVSQRAESIENAAGIEANKNGLYTQDGTYNTMSAGTLYTEIV